MQNRHVAGNRDAPTVTDLERAPNHDVPDMRTTGTNQDRSRHRDYTWFYEDLLE